MLYKLCDGVLSVAQDLFADEYILSMRSEGEKNTKNIFIKIVTME